MLRMDFENFRIGIVNLVVGLAAALNTAYVPPASLISYEQPQSSFLTESKNLLPEIISPDKTSETIQDLNSIVESEGTKLEMIIKPTEEAVPVSQDVYLYTVRQPSPKPTPSPKIQEATDPEIANESNAKPSELPSPSPTQPQTSPSSNSERLFQMINEYRARLGLNVFEKDEKICEYAAKRAPMVNGELANGNLHQGFRDLNLPYWATENIAAYSTIEENFKFWLSDYIHKKAIESDNKYSCLACDGSSCSQIFTSFVNKN